MRVGIVGYGLAGRVFHAALVRAVPGARVAAVVVRDPARRQQALTENPGVRCVDTVEELIRTVPVDLVVIASPTATHVGTGLACIEAGIPLVVDKPVAATAEDAHRLVAAADAAGVPMTVFQNRRWDSDQLTLRRLIADGSLGRIFRYESRIERWRPVLEPGKWREELPAAQGGGVLLDLGSHLVDQAIQLFGPVRSVYAEIGHERGAPGEDDVFIALSHDHVHAHVWCGSVVAAPGPRLRVLGTQAAFVVNEVDQQEEALRAGQPPSAAATPTGFLVTGDTRRKVTPEPGRWSDFYPHVREWLHNGATTPVDPHDAVATQVVLDAAQRSALHGTVVTL